MIIDQNRKTEIRKIINLYSDEELIDKDFAFGLVSGIPPAHAITIDEIKKLMEMLRRSSKSQDKAGCIMIWLTVVLVVLTLVLVVLTFYLIKN